MSVPQPTISRETEWRRRLAATTVGLLLFETLTGLAIFLLPFSISNQLSVLLHTAVGLVFLVPYGWYQYHHLRMYGSARMTHVKLTGFLAMIATTVAIVSGVALTYQALLGTRISYVWDTMHIVATFALIAAAAPHILALMVRNAKGLTPLAASIRSAEKSFGIRVAGVTVLLFVVLAAMRAVYSPVELVNSLPEDYSLLYGEDRPFAPSLARTNTNQAFDPRSMSGSASCGTSGCHEEILAEWQVSAHRYAAMDPGFRAVQAAMGQQNGPESTRYCAGCHDPISLFAGTKNLFVDDLTDPLGLDEGISCITCHSIIETDVQGNANYVVRQPDRYLYELEPEGAKRGIRDFLIRAYPRQHKASLSHRLFKSPEFCAACHKQFIDEEINQVGWVQLQNQYDNWRKSRWNHPDEPEKTIECRECHMALTESLDPARGDDADYNRTLDDGKHRSHRFLGANQFIPKLLDLPGADEHVELTRLWLRGEIDIPEIADKWREGPVIPLELLVPEQARPGEPVNIRTRLTNNKAGHDFPTGPLDIIQAWVEITVRDQDGGLVFQSGARDEDNFIQEGSFLFKAEPVDRYGNLIDRHNLWEMVGVRYRRSLFPGFSDQAQFEFLCPARVSDPQGVDLEIGGGNVDVTVPSLPGRAVTELRVTAKLLYRKFDQHMLNFLEPGTELTAPVTVMSEDYKVIPVVSGSGP